MKNTVILTHGIPGSGKSYAAKQAVDSFVGPSKVCSADNYFVGEDGVYRFDENLLGKAHGYCRYHYFKSLEDNIPLIVVDNTNLAYREIRDYIFFAAVCDYRIILIESEAPWANDVDECFKRNQHGVSLDILNKMHNRKQPVDEIIRFCLENLGVAVEYQKGSNIQWN